MKEKIECPYCDGQATLEREGKSLTYRKEQFTVVAHYYKCNKCNEEFTTTESDTITLVQAHNQYREKFGIPFIEEIVAIREKYDLSASKMSEVLGLGANGYSNYEKGEIPSQAIGNLISNADNPEVFNGMVEKAKHYFSESAFEKVKKRIQHIIERQHGVGYYQLALNQHSEPNCLTGYRKINKDKVAHILIAFTLNCDSGFNDRLKLNKLLFYTDFANYKNTGYSITGLSYRAIQHGPVPTNYDNIFAYFQTEGIINSNWVKENKGTAKEYFFTEKQFDSTLFTESEKETIDTIIYKFKNTRTWDLVDLSHEEKGWIQLNHEKGVIDFQKYAFELQGV